MHCFTTSSLLPDWTDWNQVLHPLVIRTRLPSLCQRQDEHKKDRGLEVLRASVVLAALSRHWALGLGHWLLRNPPPPPAPSIFIMENSVGRGKGGGKLQEVLTAQEHLGIWEWE